VSKEAAAVVTARGVTVRIYPRGDRRHETWLLAYYAGSQRRRATFRGSLELARKRAKDLCGEVVAGNLVDALHLTPLKQRVFASAEQAAARVGRPVDLLCREAAEAQMILGEGVSLSEAAKYWRQHHRGDMPRVTVSQAATEMLTFLELQVQNKRRSKVHLESLRTPLTRFGRDFALPIADVQTAPIEHWLQLQKLAPRTLDNYRAAIIRLFRWARGRYLAADGQTAADRVAAIRSGEERGEIEIWKPWELAPLLGALPVDLLPCVALGAFAGLRTAEICRLEWSAVRMLEQTAEFPHGFIEIKRATAKQHRTAARRIIPIQTNLAHWLEPYVFRSGPVSPYPGQPSLARAITREIGKLNAQRKKQRQPLISRPANGARHSYGSYRLPVLKSAAQLALEMGNSEKEVFDAYREVVTPREVETWWNIVPVDVEQMEFPKFAEG